MKTEWYYKTEIGENSTTYEFNKIVGYKGCLTTLEVVCIRTESGRKTTVTCYREDISNFSPNQCAKSNSTKEEFESALKTAEVFSENAKIWLKKRNEATKEIYIDETGDPSVGINSQNIAILKINDAFADALIADDTLQDFKQKLGALICEFYGPEFETEIDDNFTPKHDEI